jgi:hypothetical protein
MNSPIKNVAGLAPPGFFAAVNNRKANKAFGMTQHAPPSTAETIAAHPPSSAAIAPATTVAINCRETKRSIWFIFATLFGAALPGV